MAYGDDLKHYMMYDRTREAGEFPEGVEEFHGRSYLKIVYFGEELPGRDNASACRQRGVDRSDAPTAWHLNLLRPQLR